MSLGPHYVYGLLAAQGGRPAADCTGLAGAAVDLLTAGDLAALVSRAEATHVQRTRRNMLAHTAVLEQAIGGADVLPLRFGTVAPSPASLRACIAAHRVAFHAALADIAGQVELSVKASWKPGHVYTHIIDRDPAVRQLRDRLRLRPANETYYERIELGRRVEASLAEQRQAEAAGIMRDLEMLAARCATLRPHDDDMIFNCAFLVHRRDEAAFDDAVAAMAERRADRVDVRYVGPVPPFNFVSVRADWLTAAGEVVA